MTGLRNVYTLPMLTEWKLRIRGKEPAVPSRSQLPRRAMQIWNERCDLQVSFDLSRPEGRAGLFWWCLLHGFREMGFSFDKVLDGGFLTVNEPLPRLRHAAIMPVTWLMRALWANSTYHSGELRHLEEQHNCIAHYFAHALLEANLGAFLTEQQGRTLRQVDPATGQPRMLSLIWHCSPQLTNWFPSKASQEFAAWCGSAEGAKAFPILAHPLVGLAQVAPRRRRSGKVIGVNLFGHALGRSGVSEDVRMAAMSLERAGIPHVIRNVPAPAVGEEEPADGLRLADDLPYDVNLFCMTGLSTISFALSAGTDLGDGRHNIGMWPWELPEWPSALGQAWDLVDEVWAASRYTYDAYARAAQVPVFHKPMAVVAEATEGATRADFGLPEEPFLFGFSFDGLSSFARKNPQAVVAAFRQAFPSDRGDVGLVLKCMRTTANAPAWKTLQNAIGNDPRIRVIDESFVRVRLFDLYRTLDAFISLHRSEGFGRNVAEAMLLGKPVIVSAHSGNMDFTDHGTAALVPTRLAPVRSGEYPLGEGQIWGDPDIDAAALAMQRIVSDAEWRQTLASAGKERIARQFSPEVVGEAWAQRLRDLA
jgi:glycosyltransferase involved in cell wall biosynthesis